MTKFVLSLLLLPLGLFAQASNPSVFIFGTPLGGVGGACITGTSFGYLTASGQVVSCVSSVWTAAGTGGGGALTIGTTTISGGGTNAILYGDGTNLQNATGVTRSAAGSLTFTTSAVFTSTSGGFIVYGTGGNHNLSTDGSRLDINDTGFTHTWSYSGATFTGVSTSSLGFSSSSSNADVAADTNIFRVSTGVLGCGKGSTVSNCVFNAAGATFLDPTATTGATTVLVQAGAGDNASTGQILRVANNSGTVNAAWSPNGIANKYAGVGTVAWGQPAIYGTGRVTAQVASAAAIATYTIGASDGTFLVSGNILVTASATNSFNMTVTYTDESSTSRTLNLTFSQITGTLLTAITNVTGVGAYEGVPLQIRCKAATSITFATVGTFTSVTYNAEGYITQIG